MEFLPRTMGTRPRVAVEVRAEGVVAGRSDGGAGVLAVVSLGELGEGAIVPGLRAGNILDRAMVLAAVRRALDAVSAKGKERSRYVSLVVPDAAVRVLLLDFDALPGKAAEAMAVVRFRLKKLLPFDAEHAVVSYQVMSSGRDTVRVLAVAMPCEVLAEYEALVTEAGYVPGSVLPSTLAALGALDGGDAGTEPTLVVNAGPGSVTTAIVQGASLLLHRTVDLGPDSVSQEGSAALAGSAAGLAGDRNGAGKEVRLPLVDREISAAEWALQKPVGSNRAQELGAEHLETPDVRTGGGREDYEREDFDRMDAATEMQAEVLRTSQPEMLHAGQAEVLPTSQAAGLPTEVNEAVQVLNAAEPVSMGREVTQAVSVAAAYFEDTLGGPPPMVVAAGTMGAERLRAVLGMYGMDGLRVREMVDGGAMGAGASTSTVPPGWLAGVWGALRS